MYGKKGDGLTLFLLISQAKGQGISKNANVLLFRGLILYQLFFRKYKDLRAKEIQQCLFGDVR